MHMQVFIKENLIAEVDFDPLKRTVWDYKPYIDDIVWLPFGSCMDPNYEWIECFLESRCPPRERSDIKELLHQWGLDIYDPLSIVQCTHGLMLCDYIWIRFDDEKITYSDIKVRD